MGSETKLLTMVTPLSPDSLVLSPTESSSLWMDPNSHMFMDAESTSLWPHEQGYYPFIHHDPAMSRQMSGFETHNNHIAQVDNCSTQPSSGRSTSWPASSASSPPSEADIRTSRRRAQNRIAQRTYRARKENAIKEHEQKSAELQKELSDLKTSNAKLEFGIQCLKGQVVELQQSVAWWRKVAHENRSGSMSPTLGPAQTSKDQ